MIHLNLKPPGVLSFLVLFSILIFSSNFSHAELTSKENVMFSKADPKKLIGFGKTDTYLGFFTRNEDNISDDLRSVDLYKISDSQIIKINPNVCRRTTEAIFGNFSQSTLQLKEMSIFSGHTGNTCFVWIQDPDSQSLKKNRYVIIGNLNKNTYAIVFGSTKSKNNSIYSDLRKFWTSLRDR